MNQVIKFLTLGLIVSLSGNTLSMALTASDWTKCSNEWGICSFVGTRNVLYGPSVTDSRSVIKQFTSSTRCTNAVFTDVAYRIEKFCYYQNVVARGTVVAPPVVASIDAYTDVSATKYTVMNGAVIVRDFVAYFDNNDFIGFKAVNFGTSESNSVSLSVAVINSQENQVIDIRTDSPTGTSIGKLTVKGTGSWTTFVSQTATLNQKISGLKDIYFVGQGTFGVANVQSFKFNKVVATAPAPPPASVGSSPVITFVTVPVSGTSQTVSQISFNVVTSSINRQIQCSLNSAAFTNCISPVAVMSPVGTRSFSVKVTDLGNNLSTTISYSWTVISPSLDDFMPYVNLSLAAPPEIGSSLLLVQSTSEQPSVGFGGGQFRISCRFSHMANNDPIVYPGKTGASHHHTFFGNTGTNAFSTNFSLTTSGNSTCAGGIMNRSAYWVPSMIDTTTGKPIRPLSNLVYYKTDNPALVTVPPVGLRMIANGSSNTTGPSSQYARKNRYTCTGDNTWGESIGPCANGSTIHWMMSFPDCWDGKNLDSPDHKSHMAFQSNGNCPATHPVLIPEITYNVHYPVTNGTANWRLASDHYSTTLPGGYSGHGDWMNGWDQKFLEGFINNCLKKSVDCHAHLLGDGRTFYFP